ncbi:MAG: glycosyltransferase family 4 protein, partial [Paramuribaculum sp.]|nr:glycosyltransferase family 4 protein [Paramuribaculum sp.]
LPLQLVKTPHKILSINPTTKFKQFLKQIIHLSANPKHRIAVIGIRGFPFVQGGVESHCHNLIPKLSEEFEFRVYRRKPYLTDRSNVTMPGIRFIDLPSGRIKGFETVFHTFLCVVHLLFNRVDCVNIHNIGPGLFSPLLRLMGYKVVLTYHSPNYEHDKWGRVSKMILRLAERISLGCASHIIFVSPLQRAKFSDSILAKSTAIVNGINPLPKTDSTDFLDRHGIKKGKYLLAVGRITPEKGFETLVKAVQGMTDVEQLVIAGDSDHNPNARAELKRFDRDGKTVLPGYTSGKDLAQLYANARGYVLSSFSEGFPMVLLEAMDFGLPIVASDIPASHIIELPQQCYASAGDPESFSKAIGATFGNGPDRIDYNLESYNWDHIGRLTASIYRRLTG